MGLLSARGTVTVAVSLAMAVVVGSGSALREVRDAAGPTVDPTGQAAAVGATRLPTFHDCAELRRWQLRTTRTRVGPWGPGGPVMTPMGVRSGAAAVTPGPAGADRPVGSSPSGTNVQVAGIDEPDVAKTDGRLVVRVSGADVVVTDVTGAEPRELARLRLPGAAPVQPELLLRGGHAVVIGQQPVPTSGGPVVDRSGIRRPPGVPPRPRVRVVAVDLTAADAPRVVDDRTLDGSLVAAREYADGTVRLVLSTLPPLHFVVPDLHRSVVIRQPSGAWLPTVSTADGTRRPLLRCDQVRHPLRPSGPGTLSIVGFALDHPTQLHTTAVTTSGDLAYATADNVYVGTAHDGRTTVSAFEVDGPRTTYAASGDVPGTVAGQWSLDEHDGRLRVVTSLGDPWRPRDSEVVVLARRGGRLVPVGRLRGLGRSEQLTAVRWFGDLAVVVTFRRTDPLHTIDLSDPARPRLAGRLHLPGYSSYLHPAGAGLLVGIGHDATASGNDLGAQAATFDVTDPAVPRRLGTLPLGRGTDVPVATDARSFTYLPAQRVLVTPVQHWDTGTTDLVAVHVGRDGTLRRVATWGAGTAGTAVRALPLGGSRVALVGDGVRLVDVP